MNMKNSHQYLILILGLTFVISACTDSLDLPSVPKGVQTYSLLGDTLTTPEISPAVVEEYRSNFDEALSDYRVDPEEPNHIIWLGRRTAYLGEYREAIQIFTEGTYKIPEDPRFFRHRGHRFLTLRMFDKAIEDFISAEELMQNLPDEIEPDGLPNEQNTPVSTLKSNVWYHLGLAYYLKGDYKNAIQTYEKALDLDLSGDMYIATLYWYYSALKRSGKDEEAGTAIAGVTPDIELIENDVYLSLILVFNGIFDVNHLSKAEDSLGNTTMSYGVGNWHFMNGREERALEIWERIYNESDQWPAFGYIAAEAELARLQP